MMLSEAIERLQKNLNKWLDKRDKLKDTEIVKEIDKDYEAIAELIYSTRLDYENMEYDDLNKLYKMIGSIKKEKYKKCEKTKPKRREYYAIYRNNQTAREKNREKMARRKQRKTK